jgi:transcriptional regulator with XRE-family HTH domain
MRKFNTRWFVERLGDAGLNQSDLAKRLGIDKSAVSLLLRGKRNMQAAEIGKIATLIGASVEEVLRQAAIDTSNIKVASIMLIATIDGSGILKKIDPVPLPPAVMERAQAVVRPDGDIVAAQIRAADGCFRIMDDCVVLFANIDHIATDATGKLSVCHSDNNSRFLAYLHGVRKTGEARATLADGTETEFRCLTASPVLAIIA